MFRFNWILVLALVVVLMFASGGMAAGACSARSGASCGAAKSGPVRKLAERRGFRPMALVWLLRPGIVFPHR